MKALTPRPYDNTHRSAQAAQTRTAILDALVHVMARDGGGLSIPDVAREAGVSIRTVYRNFPTKRELLAVLDSHLDQRIGYNLSPFPRDLAELGAHVRRYFLALDGMDDAIRAARASQVAREARGSAGVSGKLQAVASALRPIAARLSEVTRARLFNTVATLFSQFTLQRMKDDLGLTAEEAADTVVWAIHACVRAASAEDGARSMTAVRSKTSRRKGWNSNR